MADTDLVVWLEAAIGAAEAKEIARGAADPAALLRCQADRKILELHHEEPPHIDRLAGFCDHCGWRLPCPDLRLLAEGYGYQETL